MRLRHRWLQNALAAMSAPTGNTSGLNANRMRETNRESWNIHPAAAHRVRPASTPPAAQASAVTTVRTRPSHGSAIDSMTSHRTASTMSWMTPRARNSEQMSLPALNAAMLVLSRSGNANPAIAATSHAARFSATSVAVAVTANR